MLGFFAIGSNRKGCAVTPSVQLLWPTQVHIDELGGSGCLPLQLRAPVTPDNPVISCVRSAVLSRFRDATLRADIAIADTAVYTLNAGEYRNVQPMPSEMVAVCVLDVHPSSDPLSGQLIFPDPRPSAAMVSIPGSPFGRPWTVTPKPGMIVLIPGWLGYGIAPLAHDSRISICQLMLN